LPLRGYGLVTIEPTIVYGAVDSFFGGRGGANLELSPQRGFTPTEERIIQLLLETVFADLKDAWAPVYSINPEYVSREINPAFAQIGEDRETVAVCRFDIEMGTSARGQVTVMYPFSAIKPIRLLLRGRLQTGERDEKMAVKWANQLRDAVSDAELEMVARLATLRVSALQLARIKPGDTLWFKPPPAVQVLVQSNHLFDAEYGSSENNAAIRIERVIEPVVETSNGLVTSEGGLESQAEGNSVSGVVPGGKDAKVKKTLAISSMSESISQDAVGESAMDQGVQLDLIQNVTVSISVEVGRSSLRIRDLVRLGQGSVVELDRVAGEPLDVCVNNTVIARGEVVLVNERYGIRLTQVVDPEDRVKHL
jgi:flagellar motor switch protein FliN